MAPLGVHHAARKEIPAPSWPLLLHPENDSEYTHFGHAASHPFDHNATSFSRVNAWWLADAALLAYWDEVPARRIWAGAGLRLEFFSRGGTQCHVGWADTFAIVSFRGTEPDDPNDLLAIAKIQHVDWTTGGKVHAGFREALDRVWPDLHVRLEDLQKGGRSVWFTGHSLGAALATLAMARFGAGRAIYTFGSPRVGNWGFARIFDRAHAGRSFRYVNHRDLACELPPLSFTDVYKHVRERKYIDRNGGIARTTPSVAQWFSVVRLATSAFAAIDEARAGRLVTVPDVLVDHTPRRYAVHVWNDYTDHL